MIKWVRKDTGIGRRGCTADVSISIHSGRNGRKQTAFIFRNNCEKRITGTEYMQCGIDDQSGRIYFIASDGRNGYKLTVKKPNTVVKIPGALMKYIGDYDLTFDAKENLWFCDCRKKKNP